MLAELHGGASAVRARGYWLSRVRGLVEEEVTHVTVNVPQLSLDELDEVRSMASWLGRTLEQEAIMVKVDSKAFFV